MYNVNSVIGNTSLSEVCFYKNLSRKKAKNLEIIKELPVTLNKGHLAEIALFAMLGLTQDYLKSKGIRFYITTSPQDDRDGIDLTINNHDISVKSCWSYDGMCDEMFEPDCLRVEYDNLGISNLRELFRIIKMDIYTSPEFIKDINSIWSNYMKHYSVRDM